MQLMRCNKDQSRLSQRKLLLHLVSKCVPGTAAMRAGTEQVPSWLGQLGTIYACGQRPHMCVSSVNCSTIRQYYLTAELMNLLCLNIGAHVDGDALMQS